MDGRFSNAAQQAARRAPVGLRSSRAWYMVVVALWIPLQFCPLLCAPPLPVRRVLNGVIVVLALLVLALVVAQLRDASTGRGIATRRSSPALRLLGVLGPAVALMALVWTWVRGPLPLPWWQVLVVLQVLMLPHLVMGLRDLRSIRRGGRSAA